MEILMNGMVGKGVDSCTRWIYKASRFLSVRTLEAGAGFTSCPYGVRPDFYFPAPRVTDDMHQAFTVVYQVCSRLKL